MGVVLSVCLAALVVLSGCKSAPPKAETPPASAAASETPADPAALPASSVALPTAEEMALALKNKAPVEAAPSAEDVAEASVPEKGPAKKSGAKKDAAKKSSPKDDHAVHAAANEVSAEKALGWLKNGNKRFLKGHVRKDGQSRKDLMRLSKGQAPHAIVLACSDSRVPPETIFDEKLGELFVIRTAGEALDDNVIGSIEYAIESLGPRLLVVMGHTSCGAVNAAIKTLGGGSAGSPALNHLVADIQPRIRASLASAPSPDGFRQSFDNAKGIVADLSKRSEIIRKAVESGKITPVAALYNLDSGEVIFE